jgi:hypothetical protein
MNANIGKKVYYAQLTEAAMGGQSLEGERKFTG